MAKWLVLWTLARGSGVRIYPGVTFLNMMQASLATCCELAKGLHIVGLGICAVLVCGTDLQNNNWKLCVK